MSSLENCLFSSLAHFFDILIFFFSKSFKGRKIGSWKEFTMNYFAVTLSLRNSYSFCLGKWLM